MGHNDITAPTTPAQRRRAVRHLAARASSAEELGRWLEMLGLDAAEGKCPAIPENRSA
ncbi:hypothetical protein [Saccharopolyspora rosea]|uniref:Uncharacterized protein n=1 Tax=Saccharopolyspora rosea TaxID=524884 RepID=A0ABW3FUA5_9PSEU|nr:hypothetical protein [Saccharopolyspora rosea]